MRVIALCFSLMLIIILSSGCRSKKVVTAPPSVPDENLALWNSAKEEAMQWNTVSMRGRLQYRDDSNNQSGNVNIRMMRDSAIWVNVTKLGFEVARALVTPDSVFLVNRFESGITSMSLVELGQDYGIPPRLDYIQSLLMGQVVPRHFAHNSPIPGNPHGFQVQDHRLLWHYSITEEHYSPSKINISDEGSVYSLDWTLGNFRPLANDKAFSFLRNGIVYKLDQVVLQIQMEVSNVDINAVFDMPFNRP